MDQTRRKRKVNVLRQAENGYVLLTLLLFISLMIIAAAVAAPPIAFQIKRDREEELIHRGVQYSRAIRSFAKKNGRYPLTLDQLRDTGGARYIRKLYKDPITGGDFQILHLGDVASAAIPPNLSASQGDNASDANPDAAASQDEPNASSSRAAEADSQLNSKNKPTTTLAANDSRANPVGQVIFGVASKSKLRTIREFDRKNHYNEWLFFYDPARDRGLEIKGPTSLAPPAMLGAPALNQSQPGQALNQGQPSQTPTPDQSPALQSP